MLLHLLSQSCPSPDLLPKIGQSPVASDRFRANLVYRAAQSLGCELDVPRLEGLYSRFVSNDTLFVGKPPLKTPEGLEEWAAVIKYFGANGAHVILDYTDHHLGLTGTPGQRFYKSILDYASRVTVPSAAMLKLLESQGFPADIITVVPDPLEVALSSIKRPTKNDAIGVWFGHKSNVHHLWAWLDREDVKGLFKKIIVVTSADYLASVDFVPGKWNQIERLGGLSVLPVAWSKNSVSELANVVDYSLVISDPTDISKAGCSSNRLVTSLCLGLPTIASPMDSYLEFSDFFVDANDSTTVRAFFDSYEAQAAKPLLFQERFSKDFSQETIEAQWRDLIGFRSPTPRQL